MDSPRAIGDAPAVLRLSAKGLGLAAALVLLAHGFVLGRESTLPPPDTAALVRAGPLLAWLFAGRVLLSFLPPGEVGSHAWRELPATVATSLVLGCLAASLVGPTWALGIALGLALVRWFTLPGAMVPRHRPPGERTRALDLVLALALPAWIVFLLFTEPTALPWLALFVLAFHVL